MMMNRSNVVTMPSERSLSDVKMPGIAIAIYRGEKLPVQFVQ
ncbi:hypothetical protein [Coleofasciculus sp.]